MADIGFQDGINGFIGWLKKQPGVPKRGPNYDPSNLNSWPWPDKLERTLRMLKEMHDSVNDPERPPDKPTDPVKPPTGRMMAPQTINPEGGSDAKYCVKDLPYDNTRLRYYEPTEPGITYNSDGLCDGGRTKDRVISGLRGSRSQDNADICGYEYQGRSFPPWPAESYLK